MTNMYRLICSITVLFAVLVSTRTEGSPVFEMSLVNLTYGSTSNELELNITINQRGMLTLNAFLQKESSDYYSQVLVAFDDGTGTFSGVFLNKTIDVCKFLSTPSYETLIQLYYKALIKHENNLPAACPIGGSAYYYLRDVEMNAMPIPPYMPGSNAYISVDFMIKDANGQFKSLASGKVFINFKKL